MSVHLSTEFSNQFFTYSIVLEVWKFHQLLISEGNAIFLAIHK